ncbi:hypothetical protein ACA758_05070 [Mycoplasmopsis agassizii]|uniref:hypothetical protein n=1 Tax=Mycoplasmopsis agassizii TaxID=33922 RepID=UPI003527AAD7
MKKKLILNTLIGSSILGVAAIAISCSGNVGAPNITDSTLAQITEMISKTSDEKFKTAAVENSAKPQADTKKAASENLNDFMVNYALWIVKNPSLLTFQDLEGKAVATNTLVKNNNILDRHIVTQHEVGADYSIANFYDIVNSPAASTDVTHDHDDDDTNSVSDKTVALYISYQGGLFLRLDYKYEENKVENYSVNLAVIKFPSEVPAQVFTNAAHFRQSGEKGTQWDELIKKYGKPVTYKITGVQ